jgi:hypothetical protein
MVNYETASFMYKNYGSTAIASTETFLTLICALSFTQNLCKGDSSTAGITFAVIVLFKYLYSTALTFRSPLIRPSSNPATSSVHNGARFRRLR